MTKASTTNLIRKFTYGGRELPDPNPALSKDDVLEHYAELHPKLQGGKVVELSQNDSEITYELRPRVGEHG